jgi:hypothetical protein
VPTIDIKGADLHYELTRFVVPALSATHRVVCYHRRGHSRNVGPGTCHEPRTQHENDLAGLIEAAGDTVRAILAEAAR